MRECRSTGLRGTALGPVLVLIVSLSSACGKLKPADASGAAGGTGAAGAGGGAGSTTTGASGTNGSVHVNISGVAAPHPLDKALLAEDEDFSLLKVAIIDPSATLVDATTPPLGSMPLDTSAGNCDATGCKWALAGVDITNLHLGLVGTLEDTRTGTARLWVKTGTGMGTAADLDAVRAAPAPIANRQAFAVSRKLEAVLAMFVNKAIGTTFAAGELEARGFLIGHIVDKLSTGAVPAGVAGAKVVATGSFDIIYPNADFSAAGATTAKDGLFIAVPKTADAMVATWDVVKPAGDARDWAMHLAGTNPNNAFVIILPANE